MVGRQEGAKVDASFRRVRLSQGKKWNLATPSLLLVREDDSSRLDRFTDSSTDKKKIFRVPIFHENFY